MRISILRADIVQRVLWEHPQDWWRRVHRQRLLRLERDFRVWRQGALANQARLPAELHAVMELGAFLSQELARINIRLARLYRQRAEFNRYHQRAGTALEREHHILAYARALGATPRQLRADRAALDEWLDFDAINDRCNRRIGEEELLLTLVSERGASVFVHLFGGPLRDMDYALVWKQLRPDEAWRLLRYRGDPRVAEQAYFAVERMLSCLPAGVPPPFGLRVMATVFSAASNPSLSVWIQASALRTAARMDWLRAQPLWQHRLMQPGAGDDIFVRSEMLAHLCRHGDELDPDASLRLSAVRDPSPLVRQVLARTLPADAAWAVPLWQLFLTEDPAPEVRGAALLRALHEIEARADWAADRLAVTLAASQPVWVHKLALQAVREGLESSAAAPFRAYWCARFEAPVQMLLEAPVPALRRAAAQTLNRLWAANDSTREALRERLADATRGLQPDGLDQTWLRSDADTETFGRLLASLSHDDWGLAATPGRRGLKLTRGTRFGFRFWRWLHELRNPSTDKRQAHRHTIGRFLHAPLQAPPSGLAELSETKVPGEPLLIGEDDSWRPYLPLPDHYISSLRFFGRTLTLFTHEGVTELEPPLGIRAKFYAWWQLSTRFSHYAGLRNWHSQRGYPPERYLEELQHLGFRTRFRPYTEAPAAPAQPSVTRYFPMVGIVWMPDLDGFSDYMLSAYGNSISQLVLFILLLSGLFIGRLMWAQWRQRRARSALPLVLGGWGTRGKSGTERLKAALINEMGLPLLSKTTGCEAMFVHAPPMGPLREFFLFRSYDKATIWEQQMVTDLAQRLSCDVMLWECMGLTPAYVNVLQQQWMRDDWSTLTNAFPDHEDVQGPAGYNIAEVMTQFIPRKGRVLTTEESMLPILREGARKFGSDLVSVPWWETHLVPSDVLARFPYDEHPTNIALVQALAEEMGLQRLASLKAMADRVVPDLGVLKTYQQARIRTRGLEFVMGMSANERHGTLSNWNRMGFHEHRPETHPGVWISTVVNNRADRVARSRVFAKLLVTDVIADCHICIGTNLKGLSAFIREEFSVAMEELRMTPLLTSIQRQDWVREIAQRRWITVEQAQLTQRVSAMLDGALPQLPPLVRAAALLQIEAPAAIVETLRNAGINADDALLIEIRQWLERWLAEHRAYLAFQSRVGSDEAVAVLNIEWEALLWSWFDARLVIVHDSYATPSDIINTLVAHTPPGYRNRIMGMQNIKGTGLGYVYAWQDWEQVAQAAQQLVQGDFEAFRRGLAMLQQTQGLNLLAIEVLDKSIEQARHRSDGLGEEYQAELEQLRQRLEQLRSDEAVRATGSGQQKIGHGELLRNFALKWTEQFLDAGDAVRRKKTALRLYRALVLGRISQSRAVAELQALNQRQKGNWLSETLAGWVRSLRRGPLV